MRAATRPSPIERGGDSTVPAPLLATPLQRASTSTPSISVRMAAISLLCSVRGATPPVRLVAEELDIWSARPIEAQPRHMHTSPGNIVEPLLLLPILERTRGRSAHRNRLPSGRNPARWRETIEPGWLLGRLAAAIARPAALKALGGVGLCQNRVGANRNIGTEYVARGCMTAENARKHSTNRTSAAEGRLTWR
jgi:hypothetical protein